MRKSIIIIIISVLIMAAASLALPPVKALKRNITTEEGSYDLATFFDVNNLLVFVTNIGSVGMDHTMHFGKREGFYYPFTGDTSDILNGNEDKTVVYAAGLVLVGKVDGEIRTAAAIYDSPEYVPGPMLGGSSLPDQSSFRVYKIDTNSGPGDPDYDDWPVSNGAPVDQFGYPLLLGQQTLWAVFNDADSASHNNYFGGGTAPLGVEIQQTVWGSRESDEEKALYLKYKLYNNGTNIIDSFYISFWADPDIGGPNDDLVGCDTIHDIFFCYNANGYDFYYDTIPPAWGGKVVSGPVIYSPGDTADFDGGPLADHKNIGMSSFIRYAMGTEPDNPRELFLYARGWDAKNGTPLINPQTGETTTFYAPGAPLRRKGWIDTCPSDQRIMMSFGPLTFSPGDSQQVVLKLGAYAERNGLFSLSVLRNILDSDIPIDSVMDTVTYVESDSVYTVVADYGMNNVRFTPFKEQWLMGHDWGGAYFGGGADFACEFFGSSLKPAVYPDSFHAVEIRFSFSNMQKAYRYVRGGEPDGEYGGYYYVPFTVWDIDYNRQLNVAFVEYTGTNVFDSTWGPDYDVNAGGWEFLFIFNSDYSGINPYNSVIPYPDWDIIDDADSMDVLYFIWPALVDGFTMYDLSDGHKLSLTGQLLNRNGIMDTLHFGRVEIGNTTRQNVIIKCYSDGPSMLTFSITDPWAFQLSRGVLRFLDGPEQSISISFSPYRYGQYEEFLYIIDWASGEVRDTICLLAGTPGATEIIDNPVTLPSGYDLFQNYPNPFNPVTTIEYTLPVRSHVNISIYNLLGQEVRTLVDGVMSYGNHTASWDGRNSNGLWAASGIYFYRLKTREFIQTKKMILLK